MLRGNPGEPNHGLHAGDASIWFRWIAPETRRYEFETCGSTISTTLGVYSGNDVDSLTRVGGHGPDDCGFNSYVAFDAVASTAYHIAVDGPGLPSPEGPVILSWASATPPGNDAFERPRTLTGPSGWFQQQTNAAAGKQAGEPEHAGDVGGASVWFSWTAPSSTLVRFETVTGYDSLLAVYTGSTMEGLTLVAESDDWNGGPGSQVAFGADSGVTYRIAVDGFGGAIGTFTLAWSGIVRPANDSFVNADSLVFRGTTLGATTELGEPDHNGVPGGSSVWFRWEAPYTAWVEWSTCRTAFDTVLAVYIGSNVASLTPVASDDDACGTGSAVTFRAVAGTTYSIAVDVARGEGGFVELDRDITVSNDDFAAAHTLTAANGFREWYFYWATREAGEPLHAGRLGEASVWFKWTPPDPGIAQLETCGSEFDTLLAVYTGDSLGSLTAVASNDDWSPCAPESRLSFPIEPGTTYWIVVDSVAGDHLSYLDLSWGTLEPPPTNLSLPTVAGEAREGSLLVSSPGQWQGVVRYYDYQWQSCDASGGSCVDIPGRTTHQFAPDSAQVGRRLRVAVTARGAHEGFDTTAFSEVTAVIRGRPHVLALPEIRGHPRVGNTLEVVPGRWSFGGLTPVLTHAWERCFEGACRDTGVRGGRYTLTSADASSFMHVNETASADGLTIRIASLPVFVLPAAERPATVRVCRVPRVIGKRIPTARKMLSRAGCRLGAARKVYSARKLGLIVRQRPKPGTRLRTGGKVTVFVSKGRRR